MSVEPPASSGPCLWQGDTGTLPEASRRVLVELLKGPVLSGREKPRLWSALLTDEHPIRARLHDLFLDLVVDPVEEFAFVRRVRTDDLDVPTTVRSERLTLIDTIMLLVLRQTLLAATGERRVIVGADEVFEQMSVYRNGDEATFRRTLNAAWIRMKDKYRVLHSVDEGRAEISPVVKFLIDAARVAELEAVYRALAGNAPNEGPAAMALGEEGTTDAADD